MKSLFSITINIQKPHFTSFFVNNKQKPTRGIEPLCSSHVLTSVIRDYIMQIFVTDSKKLLKLEVLMNHPFSSINEQEIMIGKYWLESQKELNSS